MIYNSNIRPFDFLVLLRVSGQPIFSDKLEKDIKYYKAESFDIAFLSGLDICYRSHSFVFQNILYRMMISVKGENSDL